MRHPPQHVPHIHVASLSAEKIGQADLLSTNVEAGAGKGFLVIPRRRLRSRRLRRKIYVFMYYGRGWRRVMDIASSKTAQQT